MLVSILGRIGFTATFVVRQTTLIEEHCVMTLKTAARWVNVTLKQKGKEVFCILERFDLLLNSLNHGSIMSQW